MIRIRIRTKRMIIALSIILITITTIIMTLIITIITTKMTHSFYPHLHYQHEDLPIVEGHTGTTAPPKK